MKSRSRSAVGLARLLATVAIDGVPACVPNPEPSGPNEAGSALRTAVVGDAARAVGNDGRFVLDGPTSLERPVVAASDAARFAELAARQYGPVLARDLQSQHGGPIDFGRLQACQSPVYARGPFETLPAELSPGAVYYLGGFWLVPVCGAGGIPQVSVAVAVHATELRVEQDMLVVPPNALKMVGIPPGWGGPLPASAEAAALLAASTTGTRVAAVPVLVAPNPLAAFPQGAYWVIGLERAVTIRGDRTNETRSTTAIVVGSAEIESNAMRRGAVGLYLQPPARRDHSSSGISVQVAASR